METQSQNSVPLEGVRDYLSELGYGTPAQAAQILQVTERTLANWRSKGTGPTFTRLNGNAVVYPLDGIREWLAAGTVRPKSPPTLISGRGRRRG